MKSNEARLPLFLVATFLACGSLVEPLPPPADFSGVVSEFRMATATSNPAVVLSRAAGDAVVHLPSEARLYQQESSGSLTPVSFDALTPGARIDVWTTGVELRSLPPQYFARQVVLIQ